MGKQKRHTAVQIIAKLREADVELGRGKSVGEICRKLEVSEHTYLKRMIELACRFRRYGYRRVTALLRKEGWKVNHKRVERIWRQEGLKVPKKQAKRGRLWLNDGSCIRRRPEAGGRSIETMSGPMTSLRI